MRIKCVYVRQRRELQPIFPAEWHDRFTSDEQKAGNTTNHTCNHKSVHHPADKNFPELTERRPIEDITDGM